MKDLVEKLAQAEGPSRELDWEIHLRNGLQGVGMYGDHPRYTASIDAALTLVDLERYDYAIRKTYAHIFNRVGKREDYDAWAPTPAIALCIAALSAKEPSQ